MKAVLSTPARFASMLTVVALAGALFSPAAMAQWKWRDASGRVTVSDTPPPRDIADKDILLRPNPATVRRSEPAASAAQAAASAASAPASALENEVEARKRKAEQEQKAKEKAAEEANAAIRAENCVRAKSQLRALEDGLRMARTNEKGEREILDDKARAAETQRTRAIIASDCK
jgi:hypothetical protein